MSKAQHTPVVFPRIRPFAVIGQMLIKFATKYGPYPSIEHSGRIRVIAHNIGIALGWMEKGNQYDTRKFCERMMAGNYYWKAAARAAIAKAKGE